MLLQVINAAERADAIYLLSYTAEDARLVNVAIALTLQNQIHMFLQLHYKRLHPNKSQAASNAYCNNNIHVQILILS